MKEERIKTEPMCYKMRVWTDLRTDKIRYMSSSQMVDLVVLYFSFHFLSSFRFISLFSIFRSN